MLDLAEKDFTDLFEMAKKMKTRFKKGEIDKTLAGKTIGLLFDKPSTRTRISFEAAMAQLGGTAVFISAKDTQIARNEPVKDTARVLSRYLDALVIRTYSQQMIDEFADHASIPVINALTDRFHPCQVLSDLMTVIEFKGGYEGIRIAWVGDGNNMAHSWINAAAVLGLNLSLACPEGYLPDAQILKQAKAMGKGRIDVTNDPKSAVKGADVINTDVWASMGQEDKLDERKAIFQSFQLNDSLLENAAKDAIVMHCLPAHREEEITEAVLEGPHSVVWDQSENKLHMHKAILARLIGSVN